MRELISEANTRYGRVSGTQKDGIALFAGIPYAKPPVGELRWKAPEPPEPWEGVRECVKFGDMCIQNQGWVGMEAFLNHPHSEDCLYLNIWTPAEGPGKDLPVLFWIHGGGFQGGLGDEKLYHGWSLAAKNTVVVSINYRLGALGFLAHPELSLESQAGVSGNYGLLDQICALRWVKENIRAFGGDPNRIVIDGQSAGGMSVCALLASPLTNSLYSGAIVQSGGPTKGRIPSLSDAQQTGVKLMEKLGCKSVTEMRALPPEKILEVSCPQPGEALAYQPVVDGYALMEDPYDAIASGRIGAVPVMIGSTSDEGLFAPFGGKDYESFLTNSKKVFGDQAETFFSLYDIREETFPRCALDAQRDWGFLNVQTVLQKLSRVHPCPVYQYYFAEPIILEDGTFIGATHSTDIFYVFYTLHRLGASTVDGEPMKPRLGLGQYTLSDRMGSYWTNFAGKGDPNGPGLPEWKSIQEAGDRYLRFEAEELGCESTRFQSRIDFLKNNI